MNSHQRSNSTKRVHSVGDNAHRDTACMDLKAHFVHPSNTYQMSCMGLPGSVTAEKRQCQDAVPTVEGLTAVSDSDEVLKAGMSLQLVSLLSLLSHSLTFFLATSGSSQSS